MNLNRNVSIIVAAVAFVLLTSGTASAVLVSEVGVFNLSANGGINPVTNAPWQAGDKFRLAFITSTTRNATSTNINDYNAFVQAAANASSLGLGAASWKAIASTETVNARVNTSTTGTGGEAIFKVDGVSKVADNYGDLWNGLAFNTTDQLLSQAPNLNENGVFLSRSAFAGTSPSGATVVDRWLGTVNISNNALRVETGLSTPNSTGRWIQQFNASPTSLLSFYALSDPLTLREATTIPEPATASLALIGLGGLMMRRRRQTLA